MMDKRKRRVLAVLVMACPILVWRLYVLYTGYLPAEADASTGVSLVATLPDANKPVMPSEGLDLEALWKKQQAIANEPWGRDPFESLMAPKVASGEVEAVEDDPFANAKPGSPSLLVTGVSEVEGQWLAAVQGRILRVGDVVEDRFKVVEITSRTVTLECRGWLYRFEIGNEEAIVHRQSEVP